MSSGNTATCFVAAATLLVLGTGAVAETQRGVTDTEILVGTITDLSGVTAVQGVNNANAVRLAFDEVNEKGGINGRKIRYIVEDSQYQVPRAVQAINKLINSDGVFITIEDGGTPMNNATFPMAIEKNVPKLLPLSAARSMFEPLQPTEVQPVFLLRRSDAGGREVFRRATRQKSDLRDVPGHGLRQGCARRRADAGRGDGHEDRRDHCSQADRHGLHRGDCQVA